jgi:hypothetical protein
MKRLKAPKTTQLGVAVKPESDDDWMIRGETINGNFVPDMVPLAAFDEHGHKRHSTAKILTPEMKYAEKHFSSFKAAARFCQNNGWEAIEGY